VFELRKARDRGHVLEGLAVALANIDDFIAIIRGAPTPPVAKVELMNRGWDSQMVRTMLTRARDDGSVVNADDYRPEGLEREYGLGQDGLYRLSDTQAQEILQMRLQRLTGLEQDKIVAEYKEVMSEIEDLLDILAKPERVSTIIGDELGTVRQEFGQTKIGARRSEIEHSAQDLSTEDLITPTDMVVTLSHSGYIKSPCRSTALKSVVAVANKPPPPKKTTGSTSFSSPTHTTICCVSRTVAVFTGSKFGKCQRVHAAPVDVRSSTCSRCKKAKRSTWCWP
jgi:DNA gyrase subunit A